MSALPQTTLKGAIPAPRDERELARAFASFAEAARSLELSYAQLQAEVRHLRGELEEANRDLAKAREALGRRQALAEMSALLAHEVRNPLGSLELFAGLIAESSLGPGPGEWAQQLQTGLRALTATVNNILHFHGQPPPNLARTELGPLLLSLEHFLRPLATQSGVRLETWQELDQVFAMADAHQLEQVLLNLALNAFRCMPGGGVLKIEGRRVVRNGNSPVALLEIADSGGGIQPDDLERIFQPGFSTRSGSPGLGLAVCKTIVEQHGGNIGVVSRPGAGAAFRVEIPLLEASQ